MGLKLVKIRRRVSRKRYYNKACYEYERFFIELQKRFHDTLTPFLEKYLKMHVIKKENKLIIELSLERPLQSIPDTTSIPYGSIPASPRARLSPEP